METAESDATRSAFRRRRAALHAAAGKSDLAAEQWVAAFRELPDDELLELLGKHAAVDARPESHAALLNARLALAATPERRAAAARELGAIRVAQRDFDEAERLFRLVLEARPDDAVALESLETIAGVRQAREQMLGALRADVEAAGDDAARSVALLALAEACLEESSRASEGFRFLREATEADPASSEAARRFLAEGVARKKWKEVASAGEAWLAAAAPEDRFEALKVTGLSLVGTSKFRTSALGYLTEAHGLQPADPEVVDGLDTGLCAEKQTDRLLEVLRKARRTTRARNDERRWLVREAEILWREAGDMEAAEKMFRRVRASEPRNMTALLFYEAYLAQHEDWKRLHAVLSQKFTLVEPDERVDVAIQMAELAEHHMQNLDKAIEAYRRVLGADPGNLRAADQLAGLYRKTRKWHALLEFLNAQVRRLPDDEVEKKVALLFQVIDVYQDPEKLPVEEMVIHTYNRIVELSPSNATALDSLAQRYEDARRWSELVQVLQKKIEATTDEDTLLDLFHQVADLYLSKMSNESQAIPFLERILELDPTNLDVVRKLRGIYKAKHNLERLYATYQAELVLLPVTAREPVLTELAMLAMDKLYWHDEAIGHWNALLELSPRNEKAVSSLFALYSQQQRWEDYVGLLDRRLDSARTKRKRVELLEKLGQIRFEKLGQAEEAKAVYREILDLTPQNDAARKALQRICIATQEWDELKGLYAEHEDWAGYIRFLDDSREKEDDQLLRTEIQLEAARVHEEKQHDLRRAVQRLEAVLADDEANTNVARMLEERYASLGSGYEEARLRVLGALADHCHDPAEVVAALRTGSEILAGLDRHAPAFDWARRAIDRELDEGRVEAASLDRLERTAEASDRWQDLAAWYGEAAARLGEPGERQDILRRQARLLGNRLRQNTEAVQVYEELANLDPSDWDALRALEELTRVERDWPGFEAALRRQMDALQTAEPRDEAAIRTTHLKLGELYEDILDDPDQAVVAYRAMLEMDAGDADAVQGLDRIFQLDERWEDLLALLLSELDRIARDGSSVAERVELELRVAHLLYEKLSDADGAIGRLEAAVGMDPEHVGALALLEKLFDDGESRQQVGLLLEPILRELGRHQRLVEVLTDRLAATVEAEPRRALLADIASLRETHVGDAHGAFVLRAEQVALAPRDAGGRHELERLADMLNRWDDVARLYAACVGLPGVAAPLGLGGVIAILAGDTIDEIGLTGRLAEIYEAQLEDLDRATECHERVRLLCPDDIDVLAALERLHARREDWEALLAVFQQKVALSSDPDQRKAIYLDICQLLRDELGRPEDSIEYYRAFLSLDEGNLEAIGELEGLFAQFGRWSDLVILLRHKLSICAGREDRVRILFELAVTFRDRLADVDQAIEAFVAILREDAEHAATIDALESLLRGADAAGYEQFALRVADIVEPWFRQRGQWEREVGVLRVRAELAVEDRLRAAHLRVVGQRLEENRDDLREAFEVYSDAFRLDPADEDGGSALMRVAESLECWADFADVLEEGARDDDPAVAVPILLRVGVLCRVRLADTVRAIETYRRVLDLEPLHPEALEALDELYEASEQPTERVLILQRRAEIAEDERQRRRLLFDVGRIHQELGNVAEAIEGFCYVAEHGDAASEEIARKALDRLQTLYEASEQWQKLVHALLVKAEVSPGLPERKAYIMRAAETSELRLGNAEEAVVLYERVLGMDPDDRVAFENLRRLLSQAERWDDLEVLLLDARAHARDDAEANTCDFMLGQLYDYRLRRRGDALDRYEAILDRTPDFVAALSSLSEATDDEDHGLRASAILVRAHTESDDAEKLATVLTRRLERWPDSIDVHATHVQLARLLEHRFDDKQKAFESLCQAALVEWSTSPEIRPELTRLAREVDGWEDLEIVDREALGRATDRAVRVAILLEMARVARQEREDAQAAEGIFREVLDEDPGHRQSLEALQVIYEETDRPRELVDILRLQAEFSEEPAERIGILYSIGAIQQRDPELAHEVIDTYEQILAEDPQEHDAYRRMAAVHEQQDDWEAVVQVLGRELDVLDLPEERRATRRRMAEILHDRVRDRDRALDAVTSLLEMDERDDVALRILEACHAERHAYDRVIRQLIPIYERAGQWDRLVRLYRAHSETADRKGQMWALEQIRAIQAGQLGDDAGAFHTLQDIARLVPEDQGRWAAIEELAGRLGLHRELVRFYEELLEQNADAPYTVAMALRTAGFQEEPLGAVDDAIRSYRFALDRDPSSAQAISALSRIFEGREQWQDLVELRQHAVEQSLGESDRKAALFDIARLYRERLDRAEEASVALLRILDSDPQSREALARLEGLFREMERWEDVEDLFRRWLEVAEPPNETTAVRYRLALFLVEQRHDIEGALDAARRILEEKRNHELTTKLLTRLLVEPAFEMSIEARSRVADLLEGIYDDGTPWQSWVAVYEAQLCASTDDGHRMLLHEQLGTLYLESAGDPRKAFAELGAAFALEYGSPELERSLEDLAADFELWEELRDAYEAGLDTARDDSLRVRYMYRLGELHREQLQRPDLAARWYEAVLERQPHHAEGLAALDLYYGQAAQWADLVRIRRLRLDSTSDVSERVSLLYQLAAIELDRLGHDERAIEALREILGLDPGQAEAKDRLETLYGDREEWDELVEVYRAKLTYSQDDDERIELYGKTAQVQERMLEAPADAVATYREILALSSQNVYALTSLERLYPQIGDFTGLLDVLASKRALFRDPRDRVAVDFQMGALLVDRLGNPEQALEHFRLVLDHTPGHGPTVRYLEQLLAVPEVRMHACFVLEPIYTQSEDHEKLASLLEVQLEDAGDGAEQVDFLKRIAELRDGHLDDPDGAIEALGRALLLDPSDQDVRASLRTVADRSERWEALAEVYREALARTTDVDLTRELSSWLAELCEHHLQDPDTAIEYYRQVLAFDEFNAAARASLGRLLESRQRWDELSEALRSELLKATPERLGELRHRLGRILLDEVDDPEGALELYKEILWADPDDARAHLVLGDIARRHGFLRDAVIRILKPVHQGAERWDDVVSLLLLGLEGEETPELRAQLLVEAAEVCLLRLGDPERAFDYYRQAVQAAPGATAALRELQRLAQAHGRWAELDEVYDTLAFASDDPARRQALLLEAGRMARVHLQDHDRAEARYREVLELDPESFEALDALEHIYESQGKVKDLIAVCETKAAMPIEVGERVQLYRKIAVAAGHRQDSAKAEESWLRLLDLDSGDQAALCALESLYRSSGDYLRLAEVMDRRAEATEDIAQLVAVKLELARLLESKLDDRRAAVEAYEEALELDESSEAALEALDRLYEEAAEHSQLARILRIRLERAGSEGARLESLVRLARIEERHLGLVDSAIQHYEEVLDVRPDHVEAIDELIRIYHRHERWEGLVDAYSRKLELTSDPAERVALRTKAAEVCLTRLNDTARARSLVDRVLEAEPGNARALGLQARLMVTSDRADEAIGAYERLIPTLADGPAKLEALVSLGTLYLRETDNTARALVCFRDALGIDPEHVEASKLLREVLYARESWEALVPVLERAYTRAENRQQLADTAHEIARLYRDRLERPDDAYKWLRAGYNARRDHRAIVEDLVEFLLERGNLTEATPLLAWLVSYLEAKRMYAELAEQSHRLGALFERLGQPDKALRYYQVANQYDSRNVQNLLALGRLLLDSKKPEKALQTLQGLLLLQHDIEDESVKVQMFLHLAKACIATGDKAKARRHIKRLLTMDREHAEGNALLQKL